MVIIHHAHLDAYHKVAYFTNINRPDNQLDQKKIRIHCKGGAESHGSFKKIGLPWKKAVRLSFFAEMGIKYERKQAIYAVQNK